MGIRTLLQKLLIILRVSKSPDSEPRKLRCVIDGRSVICQVIQANGLRLMVNTENGAMLVSEHHAANKREYWKIWSMLAPSVKWEDGSSFVPPGG